MREFEFANGETMQIFIFLHFTHTQSELFLCLFALFPDCDLLKSEKKFSFFFSFIYSDGETRLGMRQEGVFIVKVIRSKEKERKVIQVSTYVHTVGEYPENDSRNWPLMGRNMSIFYSRVLFRIDTHTHTSEWVHNPPTAGYGAKAKLLSDRRRESKRVRKCG